MYRPNEPIPSELYYTDCQYKIDNEGLTPAIYHLLYRPNILLPHELYYDQLLVDIILHKHRFTNV